MPPAGSPNNSIATKIDDKKCMVVGCVVGAGTGKHTISTKLVQGREHGHLVRCGVVDHDDRVHYMGGGTHT